MRIAIFTDSYRPQTNGVVYVTEILRHSFEQLGHEVYIFAAHTSLHISKEEHEDDHIIRFPAISRIPYKEFNVALFFPPKVVKEINDMQFDVFHVLTPGPVGLMGMYASYKLGVPVVSEYCTDVFEYVKDYPMSIIALITLGIAIPFTFKASQDEMKDILRAWRPKKTIGDWGQEMVKNNLNVLHAHSAAVIVHSRKSARQLRSWQDQDSIYPVHIIPTGVDPLPPANPAEVEAFKKQWHLTPRDEVIMYVGRIGVEKNLDLLVNMMPELLNWRPHAKLVFVGDFDYRKELEAKAKKSSAASRIVFAGRIPREKLSMALSAADLFVFPSLTDTQSLAVHEAAQAGLPIVMTDEPVTEVLHEGENGYFAKNDPIDFAAKVCAVLEDPKKRSKMSQASREWAGKFTEMAQAKKILALYKQIQKK